jgi:hypothetical protein
MDLHSRRNIGGVRLSLRSKEMILDRRIWNFKRISNAT